MKKNTVLILGVFFVTIALIVISVFFLFFGAKQPTEQQDILLTADTVVFVQEVEIVLDNNAALIQTLINDSVIISKIKESNSINNNITFTEITALDTRWKNTEGIDEFILPFLENEIALKLLEFKNDHPGFSEIFVTDKYGLNVGQTNKTTDYYQADEEWWIESYNQGKGKYFHGSIEFDDSSQTVGISLYLPIIDSETHEVIGIVKAVLSITAIKKEL